jgi:hypothetical protein
VPEDAKAGKPIPANPLIRAYIANTNKNFTAYLFVMGLAFTVQVRSGQAPTWRASQNNTIYSDGYQTKKRLGLKAKNVRQSRI